ncbi:ABC transporter permease [Dictyobacter aurantiacus]|uniref:ABC transporter permease n=1 Tax=Dictyobacter aurantiacus TaxID=1936993 RepID=A0A401ZMJ6_9CHLR|nr:ABC transporter permease [Dictyobacter aurantiacus]GCE08085.1 ABC transporter permease [Dictyobacter aurantiacus]
MAISTDVHDEENREGRTRYTPPRSHGRWRVSWGSIVRSFRRDPRWWFAVVLLIFVLAALFAPWISPYSPTLYHPTITAQGPTAAHWLGTDSLGRDQLSRIIYGTRISLSVGVVSILLGGLIGTVLGLIAAYSRGWVDQVIAMIVDALLSFPSLILALALVTALGPSIINLAIALAVVRIPIYARIARGQTLQISTQDYVEAARVTGTPTWRILLRHILPNIFSPLLVQATLSISLAILDESVLSFLGLGVQPPTPEWGTMINDAQQYLSTDPWMMVGPAITIIILLISMNLLGDAVRDRLDPRSQDAVTLSTPTQS